MLRILFFTLSVLLLSACSKETVEPVAAVAVPAQQEQQKKPVEIKFEPTTLPPMSSYKTQKF